MKKFRSRLAGLILILVFSLSFTACNGNQGNQSQAKEHTIVDMAGKSVVLPAKITKVVTIGSVPVMNGMIFAMGEGDKIANNLPQSMQKPRWKYQYVFDPAMKNLPTLQDASGTTNIEEVIKISPDVAFTMDSKTADTLNSKGIKTVLLAWTQPEDVKKCVQLLGEIFNKKSQADAYIKYFDDTVKKVQNVVAAIPQEKRLKILYCTPKTLTEPHLIVEWWATEAGGISVTNNGRKTESFAFDKEQLLKWNPDVLIVADPTEVDYVYKSDIFSQINAVKNKRVYVAPVGAHTWVNRTIEQPLTVLWAAKTFYPDLFKDFDMNKEAKSFYKTFFGADLTDAQVQEILSGTL